VLEPATWTIKVNAEHIQNNALEFSAVNTVLHEGRHAYQQTAIKTPGLRHDQEQVRLWAENQTVYIQNSEKMFYIYRNQPVERDADKYANHELKQIFDRLEQKYGKSEICQRYGNVVEAEAQFVADKSREKYGDNFEVKIDKAIRQAYELKKGLNGEKAPEKHRSGREIYNITLGRPGKEDLVKTVIVDQTLPAAEKESLIKKEAHGFISRNVHHSEDLKAVRLKIEIGGGLPEGQTMDAHRLIGDKTRDEPRQKEMGKGR
jgi:hypothetical protein